MCRASNAQAEARELLKRFGLLEFAQHYPATLSGGMSQRVALLRTVLFNRSFLLLDEPFGALGCPDSPVVPDVAAGRLAGVSFQRPLYHP